MESCYNSTMGTPAFSQFSSFNMIEDDIKIVGFDLFDVKMNRSVHIRVGAMEEEAVGCDEVRAEGEVLGVSSASFDC